MSPRPDRSEDHPDIWTETWPPNLTRREAARYLKVRHGIPVAPSTLAKWFCTSSEGPPAYRMGRTPLYPRSHLDKWAIRRLGMLRTSTSN